MVLSCWSPSDLMDWSHYFKQTGTYPSGQSTSTGQIHQVKGSKGMSSPAFIRKTPISRLEKRNETILLRFRSFKHYDYPTQFLWTPSFNMLFVCLQWAWSFLAKKGADGFFNIFTTSVKSASSNLKSCWLFNKRFNSAVNWQNLIIISLSLKNLVCQLNEILKNLQQSTLLFNFLQL